MITPDIINASFELFGGLFIGMNAIQLYKHKIVRGVHWIPTTLFFTWGLWNLYYYPQLDQWYSFIGGIFIVLTNSIWLGMMIYYKRLEGEYNATKTRNA